MTNRRSPKKTTHRVGKRRAAIDGDVSGSTIVTGDGNVVHISLPADPIGTELHQLRQPVGDFVGREQEIETLIHALRRDSRASISGINGMGGIGKTELALLVAQRLCNDYPDAQFFINLQGTDPNPRPAQEVMATCIRAFLGPEARLPKGLDQLSQLYRSQLNGKRVLLLLDNATDSTQVRPLLPPPGSALLVTSRQAIILPGMTPLTLNLLRDKEAREFLLEIAPRAAAAADQISQLCGYLPLAIRAAGSLLAVTADLDPIDYALQLEDERNRLERIGMEGVDLDVEASFNLSYARLSPAAELVFRFLSVFPITFDATAEEFICNDPRHICLSDLVRRSLVLYDTSTKRYRLHDLARLFAEAKLSAEERVVGQKRHATFYNGVLAAVEALYCQGGEAMARGLALFDLEWSNIQSGHAWISAQGVEADEDVARLAMNYPFGGVDILLLRQHARERISWLEVALVAARRLKERASEGAALGNLGIAYKDLGETQRAIQFYEQALVIVRELGNRRVEGSVLGNLGNAYWKQHETERAIQFHEQALVIVRELGYRKQEGATLGNLGIAYRDLGDIQRAIQFYEQYLTIAREIGDRRGESTALWNMSLAMDQLGQRAQAIQHAEESLTIHEQIEDPFTANVRAKLAAWREETTSD